MLGEYHQGTEIHQVIVDIIHDLPNKITTAYPLEEIHMTMFEDPTITTITDELRRGDIKTFNLISILSILYRYIIILHKDDKGLANSLPQGFDFDEICKTVFTQFDNQMSSTNTRYYSRCSQGL